MKFPEVTYVYDEDVLAVQLTDEPIKYTIEPAPGVFVSVDKEERPVLVEFLGPVRGWFSPLIDQVQRAREQAAK
jgi:hypothetical protein